MTTSGSSAPTTNSRGELVWNPQVGLHHKPALEERESYGGIIGALEDAIVQSKGSSNKDYPENFAGIIAAIQDLNISEDKPGSDVGDKPPGVEIIVGPGGDNESSVIVNPKDGDLWFDTRQGRLFVAVDKEWYQTNGADGLPIITEGVLPDTDHPVPGQLWWEKNDGNLFIFDGDYIKNGVIVDHTDPDGLPIWKLVGGSEDLSNLQTTATLPLAVVGPRVTALEDYEYLPDVIVGERQMDVQKDYNEWVFEALVNLNDGLETMQPVIMSDTPPTEDLVNGSLWYDTESLELSIYYIEADGTAAWVPTSTAYAFDDDLAVVTAAIAEETRVREYQYHQLQEALNAVNTAQDVDISGIENDITRLQTRVDNIKVPSVAGLVNAEYVQDVKDHLELAIAAIDIPDLEPYASKEYVDDALAPFIAAESTHATKEELETVRGEIPSLDDYATSNEVTQEIARITNSYLPREGGYLTSGLSWNSPYNAKKALSFATYSPTIDTDSTFGTTDNYFELAWNFTSNEDYCWIHNNNKVFSINKEGPACEELYLGSFSPNDANGRVLSNTIGVKAKLEQYQLGFQRILAAAQSATTFDQFKGYLINTLSGF